MKKILLVYPPFCTPSSPPYSITSLHGFLQSNCPSEISVSVLDLNIDFHMHTFPEFHEYFKDQEGWEDYEKKTKEYIKKSGKTYSQNNSKVVGGSKPDFFEELLTRITSENPDIVAFSIVYSSQAFFTRVLLKSLKEFGITTVIGGPSVNDKLIPLTDHSFSDEIEFLEFINGNKIPHEKIDFSSFPDFSIWNLKDYFTPHPVIPLKTTSTCFFKGCAFCSHYAKVPYLEYDLELLKKTILKSDQKRFFLIDDMVPKYHLLKFAEMIGPLGCQWACQLRPTKDIDSSTLKILKESGLVMILWGVESGNDRILKLIGKGITPPDISEVLKNSSDAGISNVVYTMFGFPTETREEFMETISFLEGNKEYIDLVSSTVFGLQHGTKIYDNPEKYGITKIRELERTVLEPKLSYDVSSGLNQKETVRLKYRNRARIDAVGRFPRSMNFFREHMMCVLTDKIDKN